MANHFLVTIVLVALASSFAYASDPSPLQDFCVAIDEPKDAVFVNGKFCKNPKLATPDDFFFPGPKMLGLNIPRSTSNRVGSNVTRVDVEQIPGVNVEQIPGLNTLGISLVRVDFGPNGLNPPHAHPRASEIFVVLEGTLQVGFVTSNLNPGNRFFTKVLRKGDVFVFPISHIHFQFNVGKTNAVALSAFSSQNPGVITIADAVFGSTPPIVVDILTKAFQVDEKVIKLLQKQF